MPKTTFVKGTKVTKEFLNALQSIQFDGLDLDGHYPKLTNAFLDNSSGALLNDWTAFKNALGVTSTAGLVATYTGGTVTLSNGSLATIAPGTIALTNSATNYLYIDRTGTLVASLVYPSIGTPIAQITTVGGAISGSIIDLRPRYQILPVPQAIKVFGGLGGEGSLLVPTGNTFFLSGEHWYTDITVQVGATLTINGSASFYCSGNVQIDGTVNVIPSIKGGLGFFGILKVQDYPNTAGSGLGGGGSINQVASPAYDYFSSPVGSGGAGSWTSINVAPAPSTATITTPRGGNGGGCFIIEAAGTITITGTINANGENGQGNLSVVQNPASSYATPYITGGGGGSGGLLFFKSLKSITATAAATLSVKGGIGGNGYPNPTTQFSAGGGGGGYLALYSPNNNTTGATLNLSGGASPYATGLGSVSGGSFGGVGGAPGQAGSVGILVLRSIVPV